VADLEATLDMVAAVAALGDIVLFAVNHLK
jgi:hypothetical protein